MLVAIAIPVFTAQLEKAKEGVDAANIRSAYAEVVSAAMGGDSANTYYKQVTLKQAKKGWTTANDFPAAITFDTSVANIAKDAAATSDAVGLTVIYVTSAGSSNAATVTTTAPTGAAAINVDSIG